MIAMYIDMFSGNQTYEEITFNSLEAQMKNSSAVEYN